MTNGTHPNIYPALGSHSVYFTNTDAYTSDIVGQDQHLDDEGGTSDPLWNVFQNAPYVDKTGNATTWKHTGSSLESEQYSLQLLTGDERWQAYRGSFTKSISRAVLDRKSPAPKYRTRWENPGRWMEGFAPYSDLVNPQISWGVLNIPSLRGELTQSNVTVTPVVWSKESVLPAQIYVEVIIKAEDGTVLGNKTTTVNSNSGEQFLIQQDPTKITIPLDDAPDSVFAEVNIYREPPTNSTKPVGSITGEICRGFFCGLI